MRSKFSLIHTFAILSFTAALLTLSPVDAIFQHLQQLLALLINEVDVWDKISGANHPLIRVICIGNYVQVGMIF